MWFLILLLMTGFAQADVYIVTDSQNKVYDVSDRPDAVVPHGYSRTVLKGQDFKNLPIVGSPQLYNFINGAFILNTEAVQAQQAQQAQVIAQESNFKSKKDSAVAKLKALGLDEQEIEALQK